MNMDPGRGRAVQGLWPASVRLRCRSEGDSVTIRQQLEESNRECERICRNFARTAGDRTEWKAVGPSGSPNFQLIYSSVETFETPGGVMFFGTNPGGDHTRADVHDPWLPFRRSDWSSYLDDDWGGSVPHALQRAVRSVAALIAGGDENGVELLRKSPAGNFIPFRSSKPGHLPSEIRKKGLRFGSSLITLAQPRTLILLSSNVDLWKSLMEWTGHRPEPDWQSYLGANLTFREAIRSAVDFPRFVFALPGVNTRMEGRNHEVIDLLRRRLDHHGLLPGAGMRTASGPIELRP